MKKQSAIAWLKARESMDSIVLFSDDIDALKILAAWKIQGARIEDVEMGMEPTTVSACVEHVWNNVGNFSLSHLQMLTGLDTVTLEGKIHRLQEACLIYPDGTISSGAELILKRKLKDMLESRKQK